MLTRYDHFCDYQTRRFLVQIVRAFSGFQYETGRRGTLAPALKIVPCTMAKRDRQVAMISRNLSENSLNTVPMITVDMTSLAFDGDRLQNPNHIDHRTVYERKFNAQTGLYENERGNSITVERLMPLPFLMTVQIDIWTSNMDQKHQLMEQIISMIYPTFDIQNSDNPLDWTALTVAQPKDISWTSASIPIGTENAIDIASITLEVPYWISPPAKITRTKIIEQIITNINDGDYDEQGQLVATELMAREVTTPGNHQIEISQGLVKLLGPKANEVDPEGDPYEWTKCFDAYRKPFYPAITQLRVRMEIEDDAPEIVGTLQATSDPSILEWQIDIDTLPVNTLAPINAVITPTRTVPGEELPPAQEGQRYLLNDDLPGVTSMWGNASARAGAIIEFKQGQWQVVFTGVPNEEIHHVLNLTTGSQLRWNGSEWAIAISGTYPAGLWRIV